MGVCFNFIGRFLWRLAIFSHFAWHYECQTIHFDEHFISPNTQLLQVGYDSVNYLKEAYFHTAATTKQSKCQIDNNKTRFC